MKTKHTLYDCVTSMSYSAKRGDTIYIQDMVITKPQPGREALHIKQYVMYNLYPHGITEEEIRSIGLRVLGAWNHKYGRALYQDQYEGESKKFSKSIDEVDGETYKIIGSMLNEVPDIYETGSLDEIFTTYSIKDIIQEIFPNLGFNVSTWPENVKQFGYKYTLKSGARPDGF